MDYEEDGYSSEGDGTFFGLFGRSYPKGTSDEIFMGAGIAMVNGSVYWRDYPLTGTSSISGIVPMFELGFRNVSKDIQVEPAITLILMPEVGTLIGVGLNLGFR